MRAVFAYQSERRTASPSANRNASVSSKSKKAGNLVALGSVAVVAVYGAGFMRTAAAAERFAEQSDERMLSPGDAAVLQAEMKSATSLSVANASNAAVQESRLVVPPAENAPTAAVHKADATMAKADSNTSPANMTSSTRAKSAPVPPAVTTGNSSSSATSARAAAPIVAPVDAFVTTATADTKPVAEKASSPAAASTTSVPATPAITPSVVVATAPASIVAPPAAPPVTAPVTATTTGASVATTAAPKLKDGEYTGYGTSRHGDVEVYLETTDGRITYIKISQCLTQYSCSWISDLPKQVLARQSANVDGVSGATQSVNAFYYAVVQALAKAK